MTADLLVTAQGLVNDREAAAEMFWGDYSLVSHDAAAGLATIKKTATGAEHTVTLAEGYCSCADYLYRIQPINARLIASGRMGGVCCRHHGIALRLVNQIRALELVEAQRQADRAAARVRTSAKTRDMDFGA